MSVLANPENPVKNAKLFFYSADNVRTYVLCISLAECQIEKKQFIHKPVLMKRIKRILYISLFSLALIINPANPASTIFSIGPDKAYAGTPVISAKNQSAIKKIKNEQTEAGSIVSEHVNKMQSGFTTVKMLEIPENQ